MARCNCAGASCNCQVVGGNGIRVKGTGTAADPYEVSLDPAEVGGTPVAAPSVTGSRGGNTALASLLSVLSAANIITNNTTA